MKRLFLRLNANILLIKIELVQKLFNEYFKIDYKQKSSMPRKKIENKFNKNQGCQEKKLNIDIYEL